MHQQVKLKQSFGGFEAISAGRIQPIAVVHRQASSGHSAQVHLLAWCCEQGPGSGHYLAPCSSLTVHQIDCLVTLSAGIRI